MKILIYSVYKTDVSQDMILSASMGWSKDTPKTQNDLADSLVKHNVIKVSTTATI